MSKQLIVYYSYSGTTRSLAEDIALCTDGELRELLPETPYSFAEHGATKAVRQESEGQHCPRLLAGDEPVEDYPVIFLGSPNWFKTFAPPVRSFLRSVNLAGRTVIPFCTHGGGGFGQMEGDIAAECPDSKLLPGLALASGWTLEEVQDWLAGLPELEVLD